MKTINLIVAAVALWLAGSAVLAADWTKYLDTVKGAADTAGVSTTDVDLTNTEMVAGLKEALDKGTQFAVDKLGKPGGFLDNKKVRIPMPESLSWVESSLRTLGQDELADEFIGTMNQAAEQAVPEAADIFGEAIQNMSVEDAQAILTGPDNAATEYFRTNTETALTDRMRPIVEAATAKTGVTAAYKNMMAKAGGLGGMLSGSGGATDIDGYVTGKTLDGLFLMIAKEERKIRTNPVARSTELMQKVFGAYN
ncbi:MAG: DUF4197 domain-containing protein [Gammaproteobacteria bacterium]